MRAILFVAALIATAACFEKKESTKATPLGEAKEAAAQLTGEASGGAADNPVCKLFTVKELAAYAGEPLGAPDSAAMGSGCQWPAKDDSGDVLIQIVPAEYHEPHTLADGFRWIADVGEKGFVEKAYDGWSAGAIDGADSVIAMVAGDGASAETAEALLKETIKRRGGK